MNTVARRLNRGVRRILLRLLGPLRLRLWLWLVLLLGVILCHKFLVRRAGCGVRKVELLLVVPLLLLVGIVEGRRGDHGRRIWVPWMSHRRWLSTPA
ncbi:hypothetical protein K438DRAFT_1824190 [Mycena galopus ATCC 62051]|nr:hypothetical protein K438DRAFT_1824190 [Mycena galopus ATCC 62051]